MFSAATEQPRETGVRSARAAASPASRAGIDVGLERSLAVGRQLLRERLAAVGRRLGASLVGHLDRAMPKRVYIETYGCQMNVADSELMFGVLGRDGYARIEMPDNADVILVNTCAVRDNAEQRVIGRVGELQRFKLPGVVLRRCRLYGAAARTAAPRARAACRSGGRPRRLPQSSAAPRRGAQQGSVSAIPSFAPGSTTKTFRRCASRRRKAFVTVQRGCDYRCTFCIVPYDAGPRAQPYVGRTWCSEVAGSGRERHQRGHTPRPDGQ